MSFGVLALMAAVIGAGWLLWRVARGGAANDGRTVTVLKIVIWLGLAAALFAARLWPLAFMVLIAAGGVTAIELWRERAVKEDENALPARVEKPMSIDEAAAVLGVSPDASGDDIKAAHRKLIGQIHPDKGGTDYLAAKINEARDLMLRRTEAS